MSTKKLSLTERLMKNTTIKETAIFTESKVLERAAPAVTGIPLLNVALSGEVTGGLTSGLGVIAGPSKHFKTGLVLQMIKAYMDANEDAVCLFYDNEFGSPQGYFDAAGIDTKRVIHTPIMNIEDLKFDVIAQLEEVKKGDKLIIVIDSIGNLASKKEVEDAKDQKAVADMTRAKQLKSLFRMVTPYLTMADIPMIAINHTYKTQEMYAKDVVSGGCVAPGTKIYTGDGVLRAVEDFKPGDTVATLEGPRAVSHVWNPDTLIDGTPECYEIEFEDGYTVVCSDKHRFLLNGEWVEAKDLIAGDDVAEYAE